MCLGTISLLEETWDEDGVRVGRLESGEVVPLAFVPEARAGLHVLVHLGIPVEVLDPAHAADALALRGQARSHDPGGVR